MKDGEFSQFWDGVVLTTSVCPYCHGSPKGKRYYECQNFGYCNKMDRDSFKVPKDENKIRAFIAEYERGKDFFEIAKLVWGEHASEKIKENARICLNKTSILPEIGNIMMVSAVYPEDYMKGKIEELKGNSNPISSIW